MWPNPQEIAVLKYSIHSLLVLDISEMWYSSLFYVIYNLGYFYLIQ